MTTLDPAVDFTNPAVLGSVSGVVALTMLLTQAIKRAAGDAPVVKRIPTFLIALAVSFGLTLVANRALGVLEGELFELAWAAGFAAMGASGLYSWVWEGGVLSTPGTKAENDRRSRIDTLYPKAGGGGAGGFAVILLASIAAIAMGGCGGQVNRLLLGQAQDFHYWADKVLMPVYVEQVDPAQAANAQALVEEHGEFLRAVEAEANGGAP